MGDLVQHRCQVYEIKSRVLLLTVFRGEHPSGFKTATACIRPAHDYIEYPGNLRVWMCIEHLELARMSFPSYLAFEGCAE